MKASVDGIKALNASIAAAQAGAAPEPERVLPDALADWLVRLRILEGVPFEYLVPDEELLPRESIRFFYLDRNWTDALVQGALAVGAVSTRDRIDVGARGPAIRAELDAREHDARAARGGVASVRGDAETVTGFVVRSRAISGWPGVQVRAYRRVGDEAEGDPLAGLTEMRLLRLERLAPAVLLALIDGVPDQVHLEEPRSGIQFGVDEDDAGVFTVKVRDPDTGERIERNGDEVPVDVPFRRGSPGVVSVAALARALLAEDRDGSLFARSMGPAEYSLQVLQLPYRQVFGEAEEEPDLRVAFTVPQQYRMERLRELWGVR